MLGTKATPVGVRQHLAEDTHNFDCDMENRNALVTSVLSVTHLTLHGTENITINPAVCPSCYRYSYIVVRLFSLGDQV